MIERVNWKSRPLLPLPPSRLPPLIVCAFHISCLPVCTFHILCLVYAHFTSLAYAHFTSLYAHCTFHIPVCTLHISHPWKHISHPVPRVCTFHIPCLCQDRKRWFLCCNKDSAETWRFYSLFRNFNKFTQYNHEGYILISHFTSHTSLTAHFTSHTSLYADFTSLYTHFTSRAAHFTSLTAHFTSRARVCTFHIPDSTFHIPCSCNEGRPHKATSKKPLRHWFPALYCKNFSDQANFFDSLSRRPN